jgi:hypothetical protein
MAWVRPGVSRAANRPDHDVPSGEISLEAHMDTLLGGLRERRFTRRTVLKALGAGGAATLAPGLALLPRAASAIGQSPLFPRSTQIGVVSRSTDKLDIFATDAYGNIVTAAWEPDFTDGWHGWSGINGGFTWPGTPVTAVSRNTDLLDIFVVGRDRRVWTAAWTPTSGGWQGWWAIDGVTVPAGSYVGAVSRSADKLDIFVTDVNGSIQTAAWEPDFGSNWSPWRSIKDGVAAPGAPVTAVSRSTDKIDLFVVGTDSHVWTAAWEPSFGTNWGGWWYLYDQVPVQAAQGAPVAAVSAATDNLDVFVVATDGHAYNAHWDPNSSGWIGWTLMGSVTMPQGSWLNVVSRHTGWMDAFATDVNGRVVTTATAVGTSWPEWWQFGGSAAAGAPVAAVSRSTDKLDVYVVPGDYRPWTIGWTPPTGWQTWFALGAQATPPPYLSWHADVTFDGGVPVGGSWDLLIHPDGSYQFSGSFHDSGAPSYDVSVGVVPAGAKHNAFTFGQQGSVQGTEAGFSPNRDWDFNKQASSQALAWAYVDLVGIGQPAWHASVSLDLGAVLSDALKAAGVVSTVVAIVS